nr:plasmid pRiA4b ORF-3 family protein [Mycolicibacterium sphagni]
MRDVVPAVARVIDVPASATVPELHELLQAAIGWTDSHLHQFVTPQATYGMVIPGEELWPEDQRDETEARLADLETVFEYLYDFGDGWTPRRRGPRARRSDAGLPRRPWRLPA